MYLQDYKSSPQYLKEFCYSFSFRILSITMQDFNLPSWEFQCLFLEVSFVCFEIGKLFTRLHLNLIKQIAFHLNFHWNLSLCLLSKTANLLNYVLRIKAISFELEMSSLLQIQLSMDYASQHRALQVYSLET